MKRLESYEEWLLTIEQHQPFLLFVKTNHCSVCDGLLPQVVALESEYPLPFYMVNVVEVPEIAGQLNLFAAPVVLLFNEGKEYAWFARFVPMQDLIRRMQELVEQGESN